MPDKLDTMDEVTQPTPDHPATPARRGLTWSEVARIVLVAGFIAGALLLLNATPWGREMVFGKTETMRTWLARWGAWSPVIFLLVSTGLLAVGVPRVVQATVAGALFGVLYGTALAELAAILSAVPAFFYTYFLGREMVRRRFGGRIQRFNQLLGDHGFAVILLLRICPVGNAFLTNCLAGLSAIRFTSYLGASAIGFLPMSFVFALLGGGFVTDFHFRMWCSVALFVAFSLIFLWYFFRSTLARDIVDVMRGTPQEAAD